jgi:hypothetical protein
MDIEIYTNILKTFEQKKDFSTSNIFCEGHDEFEKIKTDILFLNRMINIYKENNAILRWYVIKTEVDNEIVLNKLMLLIQLYVDQESKKEKDRKKKFKLNLCTA